MKTMSRGISRMVVVATGLIASAGLAQAHGLEFRQGLYPHSGQTVIYRNDDTFKGWAGGLEYNHRFGRVLEAGAEWTGGSWVMHSRDPRAPSRWLDEQGLGLTLRVIPTAASARVAPYLGAGVDAVSYTYNELETVHWQDVVPMKDGSGWAFGGHVLGGVRLYFVRRVAIVAEGRYRWAKADSAPLLARGEIGTGLSLSRAQFAVGIHVRIGSLPD